MALSLAMRIVLFIWVAVMLGACATNPPQTAPVSVSAGLPTSKLNPGECGLFGWSADETREFVFYADENTARYASLEGPVDLNALTPFPATDYLDSTGKAVSLRLGQGEIMSGGMRYPAARVVTLTNEGWERLHPVAIVKTCQPN